MELELKLEPKRCNFKKSIIISAKQTQSPPSPVEGRAELTVAGSGQIGFDLSRLADVG